MNWNNYYNKQYGGSGGFDGYKGVYWQKGYGLGGTFRKFWKWVAPIFKKHALPTLQSGLETLGNEGISTVKNIAKDVMQGKNLKASAEENIDLAVNNLQKKVEDNLEGKGIPSDTINKKRKRGKKTVHFRKKKKIQQAFQDIFTKE
jgi:hypothetical protein